ncbi:MAG: co-chaperone DjlA, partial [Gammaproteobacteria bacterium]|nr:co-chaperone DjlA [Gammaproteobacteria bacterium]
MQWFGKAIGTALGMAVAGPWGAALGLLLGHQFDQGVGGPMLGGAHRAQHAFFSVTFEVMGHVAKIDGR